MWPQHDISLAALLQHYGYIAVLVGAFLEGEAILVMAGFAAHRGYLELPWVMGVAAIGGFLGDQFYFYLGRRYGERILDRFPRLKPGAARVETLLQRHQSALILAFRFGYGLRTVGPLAIGMSPIRWRRFFALNLIGAVAWAVLIGGAGFVFGQALALALTELRRVEEALLTVMAIAGIAVWVRHHWRRRHPPEKNPP